jgi:catechol 2,3-dioxygenase-like lactoylglutathione lyase family enzyme
MSLVALHHVALLTPDARRSLEFYAGVLGMRLCPRLHESATERGVLLCSGTGSTQFMLELVGPPYPEWMKGNPSRRESLLHHVQFVVDNLDVWRQRLGRAGVQFVVEPEASLDGRRMYFLDQCGSIVGMQSDRRSESLPEKQPAVATSTTEYRLHHAAVVCQDLASLEEFYSRELGLATVMEHKQDGGGYIFMADPVVLADAGLDAPVLEVVGPPGLWTMEEDFLARGGPGIYHICFAVNDVDRAWFELKSNGVSFDIDPMDSDGNRLAFFRDPFGTEIELMLPVHHIKHDAFLRSGKDATESAE